jgi:Pretoxin HINT domain
MKSETERCLPPFLLKTGLGCFIKGTRVQTQQGLKRIEDIKVGDYVLSSPEDGTGKPEYKRVVNTFVHSDKTITEIGYHKEGASQARVLVATGNHPFWVEGIGWTRADLLQKYQVLRMADGSRAEVTRQYPIYRTQQKNIGWVQSWGDLENCDGSLMDYANYLPIPATGTSIYLDQVIFNSDDPYLKVDVYNLEVEDFHTYYVGGGGSDGIWVHNTNCTGLELANFKGN